jgi:hypothetical protein
MALARKISFVLKQRTWIKENIEKLNYTTLNNKYYGNIKSINDFIKLHYFINVKLNPIYERCSNGKYRKK